MNFFSDKKLPEMANAIRFLSADAIEKSKSGHPGMPLGMADVAAVLFSKFIKVNPTEPRWFDRDRFVLSAGHGSCCICSAMKILMLMTCAIFASSVPRRPDIRNTGIWPELT